jgi:hypothetical protein
LPKLALNAGRLSLVEYWYNTDWHSALNKSPFEILYNHPPRHFGLVPSDACSVTDLQHWLDERNTILALLHQQLLRVQQKMKSAADKKRSFCEFAVDDLVFLKLQPYIQNSVAIRSNQIMAYKYYGPYRVLARVGKVSYRLDLPDTSRIHPMSTFLNSNVPLAQVIKCNLLYL